MRKSTAYFAFVWLSMLVLSFLLFIYPTLTRESFHRNIEDMRQLVLDLGITDLCLFTEARYTRHLSQADLHSAFQDHPIAMEHFPSGSIVKPPAHLGKLPVLTSDKIYGRFKRPMGVPDYKSD